MNIGKSTKVAMAQQELTPKQLAEILGVTHQAVSNYRNRNYQTGAMIEKLAIAFNMDVSEFVKLGE